MQIEARQMQTHLPYHSDSDLALFPFLSGAPTTMRLPADPPVGQAHSCPGAFVVPVFFHLNTPLSHMLMADFLICLS